MKLKEEKRCPICGSILGKRNKSGFCNKHRDRTGKNNPMYGRSIKDCMTPEEFENWRHKVGEGSKRNWKNQEYREKVISSITGLKRTEEFKQEQSERTKQTYIDNPDLRKQRGTIFAECWKDGRNHFHAKLSTNRSKGEKELYEKLDSLNLFKLERKTIKANNDKWYYPDILINGNIIVEFYGDYFHANPKFYNDDKIIVKKNATAKQIQDEDKKRQLLLESAGYKFMYVWQSDWQENKQKVIDQIVNFVKENS